MRAGGFPRQGGASYNAGMSRSALRRSAVILLCLAASALVAWGVGVAGYRQALVPLQERGEADLSLTVDRLTGQMQRYQDLAVLMTSHPYLEALAGSPQSAELRSFAIDLLISAADRTTAMEILYVSPTGEVLASSGAHTTQTLSALVPAGPPVAMAPDHAAWEPV